jgi:predicted RNase H-like HicB family nuclease
MRFVAFVHKEADSCYGVSFPDLPGCISAGKSLDEALQNATEALSGHLRVLEKDGDPIPAPRSIDQIISDKSTSEERSGAIIAAVPVIRSSGSTVRINVSMDKGLLDAIDSAAKQRKQTRSAFLVSAAMRELVE